MLIDVMPVVTDTPLARITDTHLRTVLASSPRRRVERLEGEHIGRGLYLCTHWSFEHCLPGKWQAFVHSNEDYYVPFAVGGTKCERPWESANTYGVCDSPEQFMELIGKHLDALEEQFVVSFVRIAKDEQPPQGGWRWHKWGPYIGTQDHECEYLADEPKVDVVYTYHFLRRITDGPDR